MRTVAPAGPKLRTGTTPTRQPMETDRRPFLFPFCCARLQWSAGHGPDVLNTTRNTRHQKEVHLARRGPAFKLAKVLIQTFKRNIAPSGGTRCVSRECSCTMIHRTVQIDVLATSMVLKRVWSGLDLYSAVDEKSRMVDAAAMLPCVRVRTRWQWRKRSLMFGNCARRLRAVVEK